MAALSWLRADAKQHPGNARCERALVLQCAASTFVPNVVLRLVVVQRVSISSTGLSHCKWEPI